MSSGTWKCPNCGVENANEDNFCGECGAKKNEIGIGLAGKVVSQSENPTQSSMAGETEYEKESDYHGGDDQDLSNNDVDMTEDDTEDIGDRKKKKVVWAVAAVIGILALLGWFLKGSVGGTLNPASDLSGWSEKMSALSIGETFNFGRYEQDGDTSNGTETLEWIVLDKQDVFVTLISKYCLDAQQYNVSKSAVSWETSSLKSWLNGYFLDTAFSDREKDKIFSINVDKVTLLDYEEAGKYFKGDLNRRCNPTIYATERGAFKGKTDTSVWWLSTPAFGSRAMYVGLRGNIAREGEDVSVSNHAVRPVIKLKM